MTKNKTAAIIPVERIADSILILRGHRVLLDSDLAALYDVQTKVLLQAVQRNRRRFPEDFMLQLTAQEWAALRSQFVTLKRGRGHHRKYLPYAFTEQGVAMLSSVLKSERAITVNIEIMRAFVSGARHACSDNRNTETRHACSPARIFPLQSTGDGAVLRWEVAF